MPNFGNVKINKHLQRVKLKQIIGTFAIGIFVVVTSQSGQSATMRKSYVTVNDTVTDAMARPAASERPRAAIAPATPLVASAPALSEGRRTLRGNRSAKGESIVESALAYMGTRYRSGGMSPSGFDCSGFTSYVFRKHDISLLRDSRSQYTMGTPVRDIANLRAGDLVFFGGRGGGRVGHVGIVTEVEPGGNSFKFVHSASSRGVTVSSSREPYFSRRYVGARRVLNEE